VLSVTTIYLLQDIAISLHDVSEPQPLALPKYQGELYIYVALVMGAIWMFSSVPLIFLFGLVVVSDDQGGESDAACCDINNALCFIFS